MRVWIAAQASENGIAVRCSDPPVARLLLYRVRKLLGDSELAGFTIAASPDNPEGELWIVKNAANKLHLRLL